MKKIFFLFIFVITLTIAGFIIYQALGQKGAEDKLSEQEMEFNQSGRAKAIENETDLWQYYEDAKAGFSIKYPHNVSFGEPEQGSPFYLTVQSEKVDLLEGTMGFDKETALKNIGYLEKGEYGTDVDWPLEQSKRIRKIGAVKGQEFMVLSRFEVCSVVFERKLYFFNNNYQIVITLNGPEDEIVKSAPEYFQIDQENCGAEKIWDFQKQRLFFENLENNKEPEPAQTWFNLFDEIAGTIVLNQEYRSNLILLQGEWRSKDDANSTIEFKDRMKKDYYSGEKLSESGFEIYNKSPVEQTSRPDENGDYLVVRDNGDTFEYRIIELSEQVLELMYLPRGNMLKYERIQ